MVVIGWISVAMQIEANCHFHSRPARNPPTTGEGERPVSTPWGSLQHVTPFIPIHSALTYLKQLIWIGSLPSESLSLLTNKHDDNIASQAVVCYWAARWRRLSDSRITNQCVVTWPTATGVCEDAEDGEGDIKPRQMGWNNGPMQHVCDRLHQLIKATAIYWRWEKHQMLPNSRALLSNYYNVSPDSIYMSSFFVLLSPLWM